jgi:NADH:ubiquinone reductase (H+-translocating)
MKLGPAIFVMIGPLRGPSHGSSSFDGNKMSNGIVIIGGGFAGFWAALAARRIIGPPMPVTLVSPEPVLQIRPRLYERNPETLAINPLPLLASVDVSFTQGEAVALDPDAQRVALASGALIEYQRLVVATGSRMRRPPIPSADLAYSIDNQREALTFDSRLKVIAREARMPRIVVIGAGFTGIELALELRDRLAEHGGSEAAERASLVLLDRADVLGPELGVAPRPVIQAALAAARVDLRLGVEVVALSSQEVILKSGESLTAHAVVLTTGMEASPFTAHVPGEHDHLGRVVVAPDLRVPSMPNVFVAGDSARADTGDGHVALQSCQHALQMGRFAGENVARDLLGCPTLKYQQERYVTCLDLGRSGAVLTEGWERTIKKTGGEAKELKRRINQHVIYPPLQISPQKLLSLSSTRPADQQFETRKEAI